MNFMKNKISYTQSIVKDCVIGKNTKIWSYVNLYGCKIGSDCMIGAYVEIQKGAEIGNLVRIQSHSFICDGVTIKNKVFIGHGVMFINDNYPRATNRYGKPIQTKDWILKKTLVKEGASVGSNCTILGGITIGKNSIVGAGSVVTKNVSDNVIVVGNPAKVIRKI